MHPLQWVGNPQPPSLLLDFTRPVLDPRMTFIRTGATATRVNSSGSVVVCAADEARFEHDPVTLACRGLMIGGARTNLLTYSEQFDNAAWTLSGATVTANATTAPDGTNTADKLVEDTSTAAHFNRSTSTAFTYTASSPYTRSRYMKAGERRYGTLFLPSSAFPASGRTAVFDLQSGTVSAYEAGVTAVISPAGNGWYRCSVSATSTGGTGHSGGGAINTSSTSFSDAYTGNGSSGIYIWGDQLEAGAQPTSYIPTTASTVTTGGCALYCNNPGFSAWYSQTEGTLYSETEHLGGLISTAAAVNNIYLGDGTGDHYLDMRVIADPTTPRADLVIRTATVYQTDTNGPAVAVRTNYKRAVRIKTNDVLQYVNGVADGVADTASTLPTLNSIWISTGGATGGEYLLKRLVYWPRAMTDAQLATLTA